MQWDNNRLGIVKPVAHSSPEEEIRILEKVAQPAVPRPIAILIGSHYLLGLPA